MASCRKVRTQWPPPAPDSSPSSAKNTPQAHSNSPRDPSNARQKSIHFQALSRFRQSHERPLRSSAVPAAQPIVPPPMHALRLLRKRPCYALTTSQAHLDFSRRGNPSFAHRFLLASIGQAAAVATRKHIAGVVNLCDPPSTIPPVGVDRASEPGASATEVAFGPCDWNALPNIFPFGRAVRARTVDEHDSVMLGQNPNVARRLIIPGPRPIKPQSRPQPVLPAQLPNVEGLAAFAGPAGRCAGSSPRVRGTQ